MEVDLTEFVRYIKDLGLVELTIMRHDLKRFSEDEPYVRAIDQEMKKRPQKENPLVETKAVGED